MSLVKIFAGLEKDGGICCSRCFHTLGEISRYGLDEKGYWFVAPCVRCGALMKWYRGKDGETMTEEENEDNAMTISFRNGEAVLDFPSEKAR